MFSLAAGSTKAKKSLDKKMWTGKYYLAFADEKTGKKSDLIFSCQLDGQWMAEHHGLPCVFRRRSTGLATIERFDSR